MEIRKTINRFFDGLWKDVSIAPLVVFRIAFGVMMFSGMLRFWSRGWIEALYIKPQFFFTYYGFEWVKPLGATGMYVVFALLALSSLFIALGFLYRYSSVLFFVLFTYVELIDKTNYLNHYYFISIVGLLLCLLPAAADFSLDARLGLTKRLQQVPRWSILTLQLQMAVVYFFAGVAKINYDWLINAMPLKLWLPSKQEVFLLGDIVSQPWAAWAFSWAGMLFDISIAFFLFNRRTVWWAYAAVVVFHVLTAILFPFIGMFPFIMIVCATIFLPATFHARLLSPFRKIEHSIQGATLGKSPAHRVIIAMLIIHFVIQVVLPFRHALYPGKLFYSEEGFRFSWRVMLMEKGGCVFFHVKDATTGKTYEVNNRDYLTMQQEKQMSTQPDMILQFAHHLSNVYSERMKKQKVEVYAEAYVTLNGRSSTLMLDPTVNLAEERDGFSHKNWIIAAAY